MITCTFEDGGKGALRHITVNTIIFNREKNKILLAKRSPKYSEPNKWSPPGGFMGRDETLVQTAIRETKEEVGYEIRDPILIRINDNPNRPKEDRQNVDFVFMAETNEQDINHDDEVTAVSWFDIEKLPAKEEFAFDHFENVELCLRYIKNAFPLPVIGKVE